jgi:hypothetical protein
MSELRGDIAKIIDNALMADIVDGRFGSGSYADSILKLISESVQKIENSYKTDQQAILNLMFEDFRQQVLEMLKVEK